MEEEPVTAYEVEEYPDYDDEPRRGLTAGPIITIIVALIIIIAIGFYFFYGTGVEDVTVLGTDEVFGSNSQYDGIEVRLLVLSGGAQTVDGTGKLDIRFKDDIVLSKDIPINNDRTNVRLNYDEFAVENGFYEIRFSIDGKSDKLDDDYFVRHIPHKLEVNFAEILDPETDDQRSIIILTPKTEIPSGGRAFKPEFYNRHYNIELTITDPIGEVIVMEKTMFEWHSNQSSLQIDLDWDMMGNYSVSAEFENLLVKDSSPYKRMISEPEEISTYVNKVPIMGEITHSPTLLRRNLEMTLTVRATDLDSNGGIQYFLIDWSDSSDPAESLQEIIIDVSKNAMARVKHTFTSPGTYTIQITAGDNGYIDDSDPNQIKNGREFVTASYDVTVL